MAQINFPQFLRRYGIKMLITSTPDIVPGTIIERRRKGYFKYGHLREVLGGDDKSWRYRLQPANFIYGSVERSLSLASRTRLNEFGVIIGGGLNRARSVRFDLQNVQARILTNRSKLSLIPELFAFRRDNRRAWNKTLNDKWVADYTYYATEVRFTFEAEGGVDLEADIADELVVSGSALVEWKNKKSFVVANTAEVPFGFSGWKL